MDIRVTERCYFTRENNKTYHGIRTYSYITECENFDEAIKEMQNNFNSDNIYDSNDDFEDACDYSHVICYEAIEEDIDYSMQVSLEDDEDDDEEEQEDDEDDDEEEQEDEEDDDEIL